LARFQRRETLRVLNAHGVKYVIIGNLGGTFFGSPLITGDADVCPARDQPNLVAIASALKEMDARIRAPDAPEGLPFARTAAFIGQMKMVNLTTRFGDLDLSFEPSGTNGYTAAPPTKDQGAQGSTLSATPRTPRHLSDDPVQPTIR
jgi:hypothetical protein